MRISKKDKVDNLRKTAKQGDFFFANYLTGDGPRKSPVFIVGNLRDTRNFRNLQKFEQKFSRNLRDTILNYLTRN